MTDGQHVFKVGQPYNPAITHWPDGIAQLGLEAEGVAVRPAHSWPANPRDPGSERGDAEFALLSSDRWMALLFSFTDPRDSNPKHGLPWSDTMWEYHQQNLASPVQVPGERGQSFQMMLILVDSTSGIVRAMRAITPTPQFCDRIRDAVARQERIPQDPTRARQEMDALYAAHSPTDLLRRSEARFTARPDGTSEPA